jgi:hypothetical protein
MYFLFSVREKSNLDDQLTQVKNNCTSIFAEVKDHCQQEILFAKNSMRYESNAMIH